MCIRDRRKANEAKAKKEDEAIAKIIESSKMDIPEAMVNTQAVSYTHLDVYKRQFLGWREVPTFPNVLGKKAVDCMPYIMQGFGKKPKDVNKGIDFDRKLYVARRVFEQTADCLLYTSN